MTSNFPRLTRTRLWIGLAAGYAVAIGLGWILHIERIRIDGPLDVIDDGGPATLGTAMMILGGLTMLIGRLTANDARYRTELRSFLAVMAIGFHLLAVMVLVANYRFYELHLGELSWFGRPRGIVVQLIAAISVPVAAFAFRYLRRHAST